MRRLLPYLMTFLLTVACSTGETVSKDDATADSKVADATGELTAAETVPEDVPVEDAKQTCESHDDCAEKFPDLGPCQLALCDSASGTCLVDDTKDGVPCDDEDACTLESFCQGGKCLGNGELECDDLDPCTLDSCDKEAGCQSTGLSGPLCDDGNPCTENDGCEDGICLGEAVACECDGDGDCAQFEDGNLCNGTLVCIDGSCVPDLDTVIACPASSDPCNAYQCDGEEGTCVLSPVDNGASCSDGDACTVGDKCVEGACQSGDAYVCEDCQSDADCVDLDSDNKCLGTHICQEGKCIIDPDTIPTQPQVPCFSSTCNPETGQFVVEALPEGTFCDDKNACTAFDKCSNGNCKGVAADCDDDNICTQDSCDTDSGCTYEPLSNLPCNDKDACTEGDECVDGTCTGEAVLSCDDENPCTEDSCDAELGCVNVILDDVACDDGDECTVDESCQEGVCVPAGNKCQCDFDEDCKQFDDLDLCNGTLHCVEQKCVLDEATVVECDTSNDTACSKTVCAPLTGLCGLKTLGLGAPCDDGNACTLGESCFQGNCLGGILVNCNDGNTCTADSCDPDFGCQNDPLTDISCEDGDACTTGDACDEGECQSGVNVCGCQSDEDCAGFEDGNLCNGTLVCVDDICLIDEDTIVTCEPTDEACQVNACNPETGECNLGPDADGAECDDGDACTVEDACYQGECSGAALDCDDTNPCTEDSCDIQDGCLNVATDGAECDDGETCTEGDVCDGATCVPGTNVCNCELDADCAELEDGNFCNGTLVCVDQVCVLDPESVIVCDPSADTSCSKNKCNTQTGGCELTLVPDGTECNDNLVCTEFDACLEGECVGDVVDCDDGNPCTDDVCIDNQGGCVYQNNTESCDDGNECTEGDACKAGKCVGTAILCDDANQCTKDSCDPDSGCQFELASGPCNDGDACTQDDACQEGACVGEAVVCDDGNVCTDDACDSETGCVAYPNKSECDDGNPCTQNDACVNGSCVPGLAADCDDQNACTSDSCDPDAGGCQNVSLSGIECDDGNACTEGDLCDDGICAGSSPVDCDDSNPCTTDSCNEETGCVATPLNSGACNDDNPCTVNDSCQAGICSGAALECDDGNPCTKNLCNPDVAGGCIFPPIQGPGTCTDSNACTLNDQCQSGVCVGTTQVVCDDENICTDDFCDPATGSCKATPNTDPCDDGNVCTPQDQCFQGSCVGNGTLPCNDGSPCTDDYCEDFVGCVHDDNGTCQCESDDDCADDGNACNGVLICVNNACVTQPGSPIICNASGDTECMKNTCQPDTGACEPVPEPVGKICNDNNACTKLDKCNAGGTCKGTNITCDDSNPCTDNKCSVQTGCYFINNTLACDDGNPCSLDDQCSAGSCQGGDQYDCDDADPCTSDTCYASEGEPACLNGPISGPACDDGNLCTENDVCDAGTCIGADTSCDDDNVCTDDSCNPATGCVYVDNSAPCDDGDVCTGGDTCESGSCESGMAVFNCCHNNADCGDSYACTTETCVQNQCQYTLTNCDDDMICTADVCQNGQCAHTPLSSQVVLYEEDFDDGNAAGWLFGTGTTLGLEGSEDIYWSVDDQRSASAGNSLYAGNTSDHTYDHGNGTALAYSPLIRLPADTTIDLGFNIYAVLKEASLTYDYLEIRVLPTGAEQHTALSPTVYSSTGESFVYKSYALDAFAGQEVRIIFAFITPDALYNEAEGVYIDDVTVVANQRSGCCFFDGDCGDDDLCSEDVCSQTFECDYPYVGGAYFREDFESGSITFGGVSETTKWYQTSNNEDIDWHVSEITAASTPFSLHGGNEKGAYNAGAFVTTIRSPKFSIPTNGDASLKFNVLSELDDPDCVNDVLSVGISTSLYGSIDWVYELCDSTKEFIPVTVDLSSYSNQALVFLHFRFAANATNNNGAGIFIDDIRVIKAEDPATCCTYAADCEDEDICTVNWCAGVVKGGVCAWRAVTDYLENFDDGKADGWTVSPMNNYVTWQVDDYRYTSKPYSLYAGHPKSRSYYFGAGTTQAATPFIYVDKVENATPLVQYQRYLDLCTASTKHCLTTYVQTKSGSLIKLDEICSNGFGSVNGFWTQKQHDLSGYVGTYVKIVFSLSVDTQSLCTLQKKEGVYVDDVSIYFKECK